MADTRTETPADDTCSRCGSTFEHLHLFEGRPGQFCRDCAVELLNTKIDSGDGGSAVVAPGGDRPKSGLASTEPRPEVGSLPV